MSELCRAREANIGPSATMKQQALTSTRMYHLKITNDHLESLGEGSIHRVNTQNLLLKVLDQGETRTVPRKPLEGSRILTASRQRTVNEEALVGTSTACRANRIGNRISSVDCTDSGVLDQSGPLYTIKPLFFGRVEKEECNRSVYRVDDLLNGTRRSGPTVVFAYTMAQIVPISAILDACPGLTEQEGLGPLQEAGVVENKGQHNDFICVGVKRNEQRRES